MTGSTSILCRVLGVPVSVSDTVGRRQGQVASLSQCKEILWNPILSLIFLRFVLHRQKKGQKNMLKNTIFLRVGLLPAALFFLISVPELSLLQASQFGLLSKHCDVCMWHPNAWMCPFIQESNPNHCFTQIHSGVSNFPELSLDLKAHQLHPVMVKCPPDGTYSQKEIHSYPMWL